MTESPDLPPPVFEALPMVDSIEPAELLGTYRVTFREPGCDPVSAVFTVHDDEGPRVAAPDWDLFWRWPGDAEPIRAVVRQVLDAHAARQA